VATFVERTTRVVREAWQRAAATAARPCLVIVRRGRDSRRLERLVAIAGLAVAATAVALTLVPLTEQVRPPARSTHSPPFMGHLRPVPRHLRHVRIAVLNVYGGEDAAAAAAARLQALGIQVGDVGNGAFTEHPTEVVYRAGGHAGARTLARLLHLPTPVPPPWGVIPVSIHARVILLIGPNRLP
jgi:hypothetical protein